MKDLIFYSDIDGLAESFPVDYAKNFKFQWAEKSKQDYKKDLENNPGVRFSHLYKCPGIFELLGTGFIMTMPWDVTIETKGDGKDFGWNFPHEDLQKIFNPPLITAHARDNTAKFLPHKPGTLETIIKLNTPWHCIAPKGVKFLMMPVPYPDNHDFENVPGMYDPSVSSEINFQLRWNVLNGLKTIKAGTPIAQLIPLTEEKFNLIVRNATDADRRWSQKRWYLNNCTMQLKRPLISKNYYDYFFPKNIFNKIKDWLGAD